MKKRCTFFTCFVLLFYIAIPVPSYSASQGEVNAKGAVLMELSSKRVLYQKNAHVKLPMASTTKVMTALVALERGRLTDIVTVPAEASGVEGSSIWLSAGEKHTLEDLLYGLMLSSGNDAAMTIAIHIGGSKEGFAQLMNEKAKEVGAMDTNFVTPHGLHHKDHYTTAYDLALISAVAMENPEFSKIVNTRNKTIPWEGSQWDRALRNKNKIIWQYDGGNGIKTGYTSNAGKCLVSAAMREDMQLVGVVLNCPDMFEDSKAMLSGGFDKFDMTAIFNKEQSVGRVSVLGGVAPEVEFVADSSVAMPLTDEEKATVSTQVILEQNLEAPVVAGQVVGEVNIFVGGNLVSTAKLKATENTLKNSYSYNLRKIINQWTEK